jgi:hypothetical protein
MHFDADDAAQMDKAIQKLGDRLVELKLAEKFIWDSTQKVSGFVWTNDGIRFCETVKRVFDVPKLSPRQIPPHELMALALLLLSEKPFVEPSK